MLLYLYSLIAAKALEPRIVTSPHEIVVPSFEQLEHLN
jgi:hypothetical protein